MCINVRPRGDRQSCRFVCWPYSQHPSSWASTLSWWRRLRAQSGGVMPLLKPPMANRSWGCRGEEGAGPKRSVWVPTLSYGPQLWGVTPQGGRGQLRRLGRSPESNLPGWALMAGSSALSPEVNRNAAALPTGSKRLLLAGKLKAPCR